MKAPDKIYVNIPGDYWRPGVDEKVSTDTEYLRKDFLLEWAKEQASITEKLNGKGAMLKAWDTLIDKIESL